MKTYQGIRTAENNAAQVWVLDDQGARPLDLEPSLKLRNHSPTGFEWGYGGSGPSQLALALLLDAVEGQLNGAEFALANYQHFKSEVVAGLPEVGWTLTVGDVLRWTLDRALMEFRA